MPSKEKELRSDTSQKSLAPERALRDFMDTASNAILMCLALGECARGLPEASALLITTRKEIAPLSKTLA